LLQTQVVTSFFEYQLECSLPLKTAFRKELMYHKACWDWCTWWVLHPCWSSSSWYEHPKTSGRFNVLPRYSWYKGVLTCCRGTHDTKEFTHTVRNYPLDSVLQ
jgi:hypothetical protein